MTAARYRVTHNLRDLTFVDIKLRSSVYPLSGRAATEHRTNIVIKSVRE